MRETRRQRDQFFFCGVYFIGVTVSALRRGSALICGRINAGVGSPGWESAADPGGRPRWSQTTYELKRRRNVTTVFYEAGCRGLLSFLCLYLKKCLLQFLLMSRAKIYIFLTPNAIPGTRYELSQVPRLICCACSRVSPRFFFFSVCVFLRRSLLPANSRAIYRKNFDEQLTSTDNAAHWSTYQCAIKMKSMYRKGEKGRHLRARLVQKIVDELENVSDDPNRGINSPRVFSPKYE